MNSLLSLRFAKAAALVGLASLSLLAAAADPGAKKPERRVPPTAQMGEIPAGVDAGTPSTSNSMQLGMPVPPSQQSADQADQNRRSSAAARAAARPGPSAVASNAYAKPIGPVVTTVQKKPPPAATATTAAKPASAPAR